MPPSMVDRPTGLRYGKFMKLIFPRMLFLLWVTGCATSPPAPFHPETLGNQALLGVLVEPSTPEDTAVQAARVLRQRSLLPAEVSRIVDALPGARSETLRQEMLGVVVAKKATEHYAGLVGRIGEAPSAESAAAYLHSARALLPKSPRLRDDLRQVALHDPRPLLRTEAARFLVSDFPKDAAAVFCEALASETSATLATFLAEYLAARGGTECLELLTDISNDLERPYTPDDFLGPSFGAESVRAAAVRGVERLRRERQ